MKQPRSVKGIALYDTAGGVGHTLLGLTAPMLGHDSMLTASALFFTYEADRVMRGSKTALHAAGNLFEFALGVGIYYALRSVGGVS